MKEHKLTELGLGEEALEDSAECAVGVPGTLRNMSWSLGGVGAGFFFLWAVPPVEELRLDSDETDPNLSPLSFMRDLRGLGLGCGETPLWST